MFSKLLAIEIAQFKFNRCNKLVNSNFNFSLMNEWKMSNHVCGISVSDRYVNLISILARFLSLSIENAIKENMNKVLKSNRM